MLHYVLNYLFTIMPTTNPRVNITLKPEAFTILNSLAKMEKKSLSAIAKELISEALELHEDAYLSKIAEIRDKEGIKTLKHKNVWK